MKVYERTKQVGSKSQVTTHYYEGWDGLWPNRLLNWKDRYYWVLGFRFRISKDVWH